MEKLQQGFAVKMKQGTLTLSVLSDSIMRVQKLMAARPEQEELVLTERLPEFTGWELRKTGDVITVETARLCAAYDKAGETLRFYERQSGREILREKEARFVKASDENGWTGSVEQLFYTAEEELLGGLGQQADGACNYKGRFVHLNQFNIISAVPHLVSTNGYGILWNNCSLTELNRRKTLLPLEFNPCAKTFSGVFVPEETGEYVWILEKLNKNLGYEDLTLKVGETMVIERGTSWHANFYTGTVRLEAGQEYPVFVNATANLYFQTPSQQKETTVWSEVGSGIDYCVLYGPKPEEIIGNYRRLTGDAPLFPKWAYGYWQSKECYHTGREVLETAAEHRRRGHPLDAMVQDWRYWGDFGWNALEFAPEYAENVEEMIQALHRQDVHFMVSVWPNFGESEKNKAYQEFKSKGYLMDDNALTGLGDYTAALQGFRKNYYDAWNPNARDALWRRMEEGMFRKGVDAWWLDATEPNLWSLQGAYHMYETCRGPAARWLNAYTLVHSKGIYEHQRQADESKRVFILSRTGFTGVQKYATAVWSGDTWGTWQTFRQQIADGLQYSLSGLPYWTSDIGGFSGESCDSPQYRELYIRWFQYGAFCPIFRAHGTRCPREVWQFGEDAEKILHRYLMLRYRLMPYIYSLAWQVTRYRQTIMRSLWMDFPKDSRCREIGDQFLFGPSLMVCPVTQKGALSREVYLPAGNGWYNFWNNRYHAGGAAITADAPLDTMPIFVKAGSILLTGPESMHTCEEDLVEICVYRGGDATFSWYRDSGDSYAYESGAYTELQIRWNEQSRKLKLSALHSGYPVQGQRFQATVIGTDGTVQSTEPFAWEGKELSLLLD